VRVDRKLVLAIKTLGKNRLARETGMMVIEMRKGKR